MNKYIFAATQVVFKNPFPETENGLRNGITLALGLLGGISVLVLVLSGIRLSASRGNPDAIAKLRSTIIFASVGLIIAISASAIISFVVNRFG